MTNLTLDIISENPLFSIDSIKQSYLNYVNPQVLNHISLYKNLRQVNLREFTKIGKI